MSALQAVLSVAITEDDPGMATSLPRLIRAAGLDRATYGSAGAFLDDGRHRQFDCLILDIALEGCPASSSRSGCRMPARTCPSSSSRLHDDPPLRDRAEPAGCAAFLRKTEPGEALLAAVRQAAGNTLDDNP